MLYSIHTFLARDQLSELNISTRCGAICFRPAERGFFDVCNGYPHRFVSHIKNDRQVSGRLMTI